MIQTERLLSEKTIRFQQYFWVLQQPNLNLGDVLENIIVLLKLHLKIRLNAPDETQEELSMNPLRACTREVVVPSAPASVMKSSNVGRMSSIGPSLQTYVTP